MFNIFHLGRFCSPNAYFWKYCICAIQLFHEQERILFFEFFCWVDLFS